MTDYLPLIDAVLALAALGLAAYAAVAVRRLPTRPELADVRQRVAVLTGLTEDAAAEIGRLRATQDGLARRLALAEDAAEAAGIDFGAMPALGPPPHNHVWPAEGQWFQQDETSRSYRCQVPRCQRVHTVATR